MKILKVVLKNRFVAAKILRNIPEQYVRQHFGMEFLSPMQQFISDGYNDMLYSKLDLGSSDDVLIIGGHIGISAGYIHRNYSSRIHIFEPIPEFSSGLRDLFKSYENIKVIEAAVACFDGFLELHIDGEKSGIEAQGRSVSVSAIKLSRIIQKNFKQIGLIEMNIEGGEYSVLPNLIESGQIGKVKVLLIQFHRYSIQDDINRALIHKGLSKTHKLIFSYDWVWEKWALI